MARSIFRSWTVLSQSLLSLRMAGLINGAYSLPTSTESIVAASSTINSSSGASTFAASTGAYSEWTVSAITALQTWYTEEEGLWQSTGWWNSANCLTVLSDFYAVNAPGAEALGLSSVFANTFSQAQRTVTTTRKRYITKLDGLRIVESEVEQKSVSENQVLTERGFGGFLNDYYDDEGWWALAWIRVYDVTGNAEYLSMAESIFDDMRGGTTNATCGGGIWWSKANTYKNAIANELYLSVAASLANRAADAETYLAIAMDQWQWFRGSGMINEKSLINDGLTIEADGTCVNNGENEWTYNQGVILGGLVELYKATGESTLLTEAVAIAEAAIAALSTGGILHESCEDDCGGDGSQFKGVFTRNLQYLQREVDNADFRSFIFDNANSIWANDRTSSNELGLNWVGPASAGGGPNASTQSSALDTLVAAVAVS